MSGPTLKELAGSLDGMSFQSEPGNISTGKNIQKILQRDDKCKAVSFSK